MQKIIFCLQTMVCGGVEKELITILRRFDPKEYDLSVLLLYGQNAAMQQAIPSHVKQLVLGVDKAYYCANTKNLVWERLKNARLLEAGRMAIGRLVMRIPSVAAMDLSDFPQQEGTYDCAVCYHVHSPLVLRYVAEKVCAKRKIAWIHNDFETTGYPIERYAQWLDQYHKIAAVSQQLTAEFKAHCPHLSDRAVTAHNIVDAEEIRRKSTDQSQIEAFFLRGQRCKIVTVGRFVEQKGFDLAIRASRLLKDRGLDFCWYAIGYGEQEAAMGQLIETLDVSDVFCVLGRKENPYPYMAMADLYVQPSRHEGFGITVAEAKVLGRPIICTNFAGAMEQLQDGKTGYILPVATPEAIADGVERLLRSKTLRKALTQALAVQDQTDSWTQIKEIFDE